MKRAPRALFGGELKGTSLVRLIYLDESGISGREPISIVAGIIVHGDQQWRPMATAIEQLENELVPKRFRSSSLYKNKYVFHATELFRRNEEKWGDWSFESRVEYVKQMAALPRMLDLAIAIGVTRRGRWLPEHKKVRRLFKHRPEKWDQASAFGMCLCAADKYLRDRTHPLECAMAFCEDVKDMRLALEIAYCFFRDDPRPVETITGMKVLKIERIIDGVSFSGARQLIGFQLADACAFAMKRFLNQEAHGEELLRVMLGGKITREPWIKSPESNGYFCRENNFGKRRLLTR